MQLTTFIVQDEVKSDGFWALVPVLVKGLELHSTTKSATLGLALPSLIFYYIKVENLPWKGEMNVLVSVKFTYIPLITYYFMYSSHLAS